MPSETVHYDPLATQYNKVFADITVRRDEWNWLMNNCFFMGKTVLDVGCGNGALLMKLAPFIRSGTGADISQNMITIAREQARTWNNLQFVKLTDSGLPFQAACFDTVISFFSFRYLDWKPMLEEIIRVLKPGGRLVIIDMAGAGLTLRTLPLFLLHKFRLMLQLRFNPVYKKELNALVKHEQWRKMLEAHPIRQLTEYRRFFTAWLPGKSLKVLNAGWKAQTFGISRASLLAGEIPSVALLDWGIGGLSVYKILKAHFPQTGFCYISDSGFTPYGKVTDEHLSRRLTAIIRFLELRRVTHLAVACNAMSTVLHGNLFRIPAGITLTGVIQPTVDLLKNRGYHTLGVIGGRRTVRSHLYSALLKTSSTAPHIIERVAQPLSAFIERGEQASPAFTRKLQEILTPLKGVEALVLGCTHYSAVSRLVQSMLPGTEIIDVCRQRHLG